MNKVLPQKPYYNQHTKNVIFQTASDHVKHYNDGFLSLFDLKFFLANAEANEQYELCSALHMAIEHIEKALNAEYEEQEKQGESLINQAREILKKDSEQSPES